ncbi:hypothetical protein ADE_15800 [Achromobacter denitrificans]|nr:hypothetical protein ADE_15800 [Achromobacter denitrificans]
MRLKRRPSPATALPEPGAKDPAPPVRQARPLEGGPAEGGPPRGKRLRRFGGEPHFYFRFIRTCMISSCVLMVCELAW